MEKENEEKDEGKEDGIYFTSLPYWLDNVHGKVTKQIVKYENTEPRIWS